MFEAELRQSQEAHWPVTLSLRAFMIDHPRHVVNGYRKESVA
jgi:hypothetical protein